MRDYKAIAFGARDPSNRQSVIAQLDAVLPDLWHSDYLVTTRSPVELLTVTFGDESLHGHFVRYMFDNASGHQEARNMTPEQLRGYTHDRVVAVWGTSRAEPGSTRDTGRMRGFGGGGEWSETYGGYDRGHFFAHTMGGGLDMNLFPQIASVNRRGLWREMERYCAANPGTFCFVHPIYTDRTWRPSGLEYGIFKLPPQDALDFWGAEFGN